MTHTNRNTEKEVISFVIVRLKNFRRINYEFLIEVLQTRFQLHNPDNLVRNTIIKTNRAELKGGYLLMN